RRRLWHPRHRGCRLVRFRAFFAACGARAAPSRGGAAAAARVCERRHRCMTARVCWKTPALLLYAWQARRRTPRGKLRTTCMSSTAGHDLEFKLDLPPQELERAGPPPVLEPLTVGKPATQTLRSIYFDTRDHRLRAHQLMLRLRSRDGGQWTQTIKVA